MSCKYGHVSGIGEEVTDDDGWATFEIIEETVGNDVKPIHKIWVDDQEVSDDYFLPSDGDTFSFVRP